MNIVFKSVLIQYGLIKLLLVATFIYSLNFTNHTNAATEIVCSGEDLIAELEKSAPKKLAALRAQAAKTRFGTGRFWKISKSGVPDSWLLGTMHVADKSIVTLPGEINSAFANSDTVLVEVTDILDPIKAQAELMRLKHLAFRLDGSTIESDISPENLEKLKAAIDARGMPYQVSIRMQPWMLAPAIGIQLCEVEAKKRGKEFLDARIMRRAMKEGKTLIALETTEEQLTAISSVPRDFQITSLVETLELGAKIDDVKKTMKNLYLSGQISMIVPLIRMVSVKSASGKGFEEFQKKLVVQRNKTMVERAAKYFAKGHVFMAVGALHLPGEKGILSLLTERGFQVEVISTIR